MKKIKTLRTAFLCGLLLNAAASGAWYTVRVHSRGIPLSDVEITVRETGTAYYTGTNGVCVFSLPGNNTNTLTALLAGYLKQETRLISTNVIIELEPVAGTLPDVLVRGAAERRPGKTAGMEAADIARTTQVLFGDVAQTVTSMPGVVSSGSSIDGRMYIQGGSDSEMTAYIDGIPVTHFYRFGGLNTLFNPSYIASAELYSAGYSAAYGGGMSGVLSLTTRTPASNGSGFFDFASCCADLFYTVRPGAAWSLTADARASYYQFLPALLYPELKDTALQAIIDGLVSIRYTPAQNDRFQFLVLGSRSGFDFNMPALEQFSKTDTPIENGRSAGEELLMVAGLSYAHVFDAGHRLTAACAYTPWWSLTKASMRFISSGLTEINPGITQDVDMRQTVLAHLIEPSLRFESAAFSGNTVELGCSGRLYDITSSLDLAHFTQALGSSEPAVHEEKHRSPGNDMYELGAYLTDSFMWQALTLDAGLRCDYFGYLSSYALGPRIGIRADLFDVFSIYARAGRYAAFPVMLLTAEALPGLQPERAAHLLAGTSFEDRDVLIRAEGFYKEYTGLIKQDISRGLVNAGERTVYGGSLFLQRKQQLRQWVDGYLTYTFTRGTETVRGRSPETAASRYAAADGVSYVPGHIREHSISLLAAFTYRSNDVTPVFNMFEGLKLSIDWRVMSGKPYTMATNVIAVPGGSILMFDAYNSARTPWVHKLDIKLSWYIEHMPPGLLGALFGAPAMPMEIYVAVINVYNTENRSDFWYYVKDGGLSVYYTKDLQLTPTVGIKMVF
ncbi:MAG: TonB-dependent receptor [Spirochaetes bacterium]|nr:TonB-dependent receptor [Spirochaetota bacterium]